MFTAKNPNSLLYYRVHDLPRISLVNINPLVIKSLPPIQTELISQISHCDHTFENLQIVSITPLELQMTQHGQ